MPGRIAAARMNPKKMRAIRSLSFHSASVAATSPMTTRVASATRLVVSVMTRDFSPVAETGKRMVTSAWERVCLDERRHAIVLALPFARALGLAAVGIGLMAIGWPASIAGVALQVAAAAIALRAVWSWEQTRLVLTTDKLFVVHGTLRKRAAAVRLARIGAVEIEQGLLGRLLGYGTIVAGDLEIEYVPRPRDVYGLVERLST
jgi:uncharacterized membrane protein YdbT with pleckstrin-like domain